MNLLYLLIFISIFLTGVAAYLYLENAFLKSKLDNAESLLNNEKELLGNCLEKSAKLEDDYLALNEQYNDLFRKYSEALDENDFLRAQIENLSSCR